MAILSFDFWNFLELYCFRAAVGIIHGFEFENTESQLYVQLRIFYQLYFNKKNFKLKKFTSTILQFFFLRAYLDRVTKGM